VKPVLRILLCAIVLGYAPTVLADSSSAVEGSAIGSKDFWEKFAIAAIGALAGFIGNYLLAVRKDKREPRKQISYLQEITRALSPQHAGLPGKLKVLCDNREADSLYLVSVNIENSGNTDIQRL